MGAGLPEVPQEEPEVEEEQELPLPDVPQQVRTVYSIPLVFYRLDSRELVDNQ